MRRRGLTSYNSVHPFDVLALFSPLSTMDFHVAHDCSTSVRSIAPSWSLSHTSKTCWTSRSVTSVFGDTFLRSACSCEQPVAGWVWEIGARMAAAGGPATTVDATRLIFTQLPAFVGVELVKDAIEHRLLLGVIHILLKRTTNRTHAVRRACEVRHGERDQGSVSLDCGLETVTVVGSARLDGGERGSRRDADSVGLTVAICVEAQRLLHHHVERHIRGLFSRCVRQKRLELVSTEEALRR